MQNKLARYALDNSSKFYPILRTRKSESLFRLVAEEEDEIVPQRLQQAAADALKRFPTMKVSVKIGYNWHYLEENVAVLPVAEHDGTVLKPIDTKANNGFRIRVSYKGKMIFVDFFHALTDGRGATEFFKVLLLRYGILSGRSPQTDNVMNFEEDATDEELEDSFHRYYKKTKLSDINLKAFMGKKPVLLGGTPCANAIDAESVGTSALKSLAKSKGVSLTALIGGVLLYAIARTRPKAAQNAPLAMMIPVDLRTAFPSATLRNFVLFVRIETQNEARFTLDDYIRITAEQLAAKTKKEELSKTLSTTVRSEKSLLLRMTPLFVKSLVFKIAKCFMKSRQTVIFSNIGIVKLGEGIGVKKIAFNLNVSKNATTNLAAITYDGKTALSFTRSVTETAVQNKFFNTLESLGVKGDRLDLCW